MFIHVVETLRAIEAHVRGGNKDADLKIFKTYVSMDKRLGPPKKKDDCLLAPPSKVANRPRGSNRVCYPITFYSYGYGKCSWYTILSFLHHSVL